MTYGMWLSAAGLQVNEYRQSLMANNIANIDTTGFKHDLALIHERQAASRLHPVQNPFTHPVFDQLGGGLGVRPTFTSFTQGELVETGNTLDLAIAGDGFFTVRDGDQVRYTRDGQFTRAANGQLVMVSGEGRFKVLNTQGQPVFIDPALGELSIAEDGTIRQGLATIGQLAVVDFADRTHLSKRGANVYENVGNDHPQPASGRVQSGQIERSTVNPAESLASMIEVSRAYELNGRMIQLQDETLNHAVNSIGRIG